MSKVDVLKNMLQMINKYDYADGIFKDSCLDRLFYVSVTRYDHYSYNVNITDGVVYNVHICSCISDVESYIAEKLIWGRCEH